MSIFRRSILITVLCNAVLFAQTEGAKPMNEEKKFTEQECHKNFAIQLNNLVWNLLQKENRTTEDNDKMIHAAHASYYHWSVIGEPINFQRGEWLISHVYAVLNIPEPALYHARKCMELTEEYKFVDFDLAYAYEALARAYAAAGNLSEAKKYIQLAQEAGEKIKQEEDRKLFMSDFAAEPWYGVK
jgi:tetratricopeptide (TPR) repeat protein